jgi:hypothetical protein
LKDELMLLPRTLPGPRRADTGQMMDPPTLHSSLQLWTGRTPIHRPRFTHNGDRFSLIDMKRNAHRHVVSFVLAEINGGLNVKNTRAIMKWADGSNASRTPSKMNTRSDNMIAKVKMR